jgi:hypothetical protein
MKKIILVTAIINLVSIGAVYSQDVAYNTVTTTSTDQSNQTSLHISGLNSPTFQAGARNISFDFAGAAKAQIQAYRGSAWGTYFEFLTSDESNTGGIPSVRMHIDANGNVGFGTSAPSSVVSILHNTPIIQLFDKDSNPGDGSSEGKLAFGSVNGEFASFEASRVGTSADDVTILKFKTSYATGAGGDGDNIERMRISFNGNVGIGTINPQNKLDVNGTIHSKQVNVDLNGWPDYVFKKDYQLPTLQEIKTYIDKNHHLPEMPSEQEVAKDGLNLGEVNKILTRKVEELTLYMIEEDKKEKEKDEELNAQKRNNQALEERITSLEKELEILTQSLNKK